MALGQFQITTIVIRMFANGLELIENPEDCKKREIINVRICPADKLEE
jgi:hypothetical protein